MKKRIAVFDLDGTLIKGQSQKILVRILLEYGWISLSNYIILLFWFLLYKMHVVTNIGKISTFSYSLFKEKCVDDLTDIITQNTNRLTSYIYSNSLSLVNSEKKISDKVILISASVEPIVSFYCSHLGIDEYYCTKLKVKDSNFTGEIEGQQLYGNEKLKYLKSIISSEDRDQIELALYTDHHSDVDLLNFSDFKICVNPDRKLKKIALSNHWKSMNLS